MQGARLSISQMPTYEFRCPEGHQFDRFYRKMSDAAAEVACPECGKLATRQISGGAGLQFKGSGFYLTDYGKNAHRKSDSSPAKSGGESGSSDAKAVPAKEAKKDSSTGSSGSATPAPAPKTGGSGSDK